jgi:uncharacterized protein (TIGR03437 family)
MNRVISLVFACSCCYAQWTILGNPPSGRIFELHDTSKAFGPGSIGVSSRSLVSGNANGLWHTENLGATAWTALSNQLVSSWLLNCSNEIVYTQLGAGLPITRLVGNTSAHNSTQTGDFRRIVINHGTCRIYALDVDGSVYVSTDSGTTFSAMAPQTHFSHANAIGGIAIRPSDGAIFVCDEVEPCEMFNGTSWQDVGAAANTNNVWFTPDGSAWACDSNNYPRKWDGSSSWNTVTVTSSFVFRCHAAVNVGTDTYVTGKDYNGGEGPYVFKSSNNGASWSQFTTGLAVVSGGESETIDLGCDGRLYVATDDEDLPSTTAGVFAYAGIGPNTCGSSPPPPQPLQISGSLSGGAVGSVYSQKLSATGGTPPYNWIVVSGNLPPGLILSSTAGTVTGTPTAAGTFSFTIQVSDSAGSTPASQQFSVVITGSNSPPLQISGSLSGGAVGVVYSQKLSATGGTPPYTWTVLSGSLPPGLILSSTAGTVTGTPAAAGTFTFTIQVSDSAGTTPASQQFSVVITGSNSPPPPQPLQISGSLSGGAVGSGYSQKLSATGGTPPYNWTVASGSLPPGLLLSSAAGTLTGALTAAGTFSFSIQVSDSAGSTPVSQQFSVVITSASTMLISGVAMVNAASYAAGSVSPGEIVVIFGSGFGPHTLANLQLDSRGYVGTALGGTQVLFDGVAAPMIYAEAGQVSVVVPYEVSGENATQVQVVYQGQSSNLVSMPVSAVMPGVFTADSSGKGQGAIINQDGTVNSQTNPASAGSYVSVFATGEGQSIPGGVDGKPANAPFPAPQAQPVTTAFVDGVQAQVQYAGGAPGLVAGVWQVNIQIPQGLSPGGAPLQLTIGNRATQTGVTIAVH